MLAALLKLGVLNPAGASVAELAAIPASPVPNAASAANRLIQRRTFLRGGMSMSVPPKKIRVAYARARRKLADRLISHPQAVTNHGLRKEVPYLFKLACAKIISTARRKNVGRAPPSSTASHLHALKAH